MLSRSPTKALYPRLCSTLANACIKSRIGHAGQCLRFSFCVAVCLLGVTTFYCVRNFKSSPLVDDRLAAAVHTSLVSLTQSPRCHAQHRPVLFQRSLQRSCLALLAPAITGNADCTCPPAPLLGLTRSLTAPIALHHRLARPCSAYANICDAIQVAVLNKLDAVEWHQSVHRVEPRVQ